MVAQSQSAAAASATSAQRRAAAAAAASATRSPAERPAAPSDPGVGVGPAVVGAAVGKYSAEDLAKFADPEVYLGNEGFHQVGAPEFIPKDANQPADSAAGVILSYWLSPDNEPQLYIVDGVTMEAVAVLNLPIPKMPSVGLHNHFSKYPPSV